VADQLLTTIAITLATKTAEGLAAGGRAAFEALARVVRRRFEGRASALTEGGPDSTKDARIESLRQALAQAIADDPAFEMELRDRWRALSPYLNASDGGVINSVSGTVKGNLVQARDINGGISFGAPGRTEP
jgi:hypothetical protein